MFENTSEVLIGWLSEKRGVKKSRDTVLLDQALSRAAPCHQNLRISLQICHNPFFINMDSWMKLELENLVTRSLYLRTELCVVMIQKDTPSVPVSSVLSNIYSTVYVCILTVLYYSGQGTLLMFPCYVFSRQRFPINQGGTKSLFFVFSQKLFKKYLHRFREKVTKLRIWLIVEKSTLFCENPFAPYLDFCLCIHGKHFNITLSQRKSRWTFPDLIQGTAPQSL